jgi:hypothetical protein
MWGMHFVSTFHTPKHSIWAESDESAYKLYSPHVSTFQHLRLGTPMGSKKLRHFMVATMDFIFEQRRAGHGTPL